MNLKYHNIADQAGFNTAGYEAALSTNWDKSNSVKNIFSLNRIEIEPQDTLDDFRRKISRRYHVKYFKQLAKNFLSF